MSTLSGSGQGRRSKNTVTTKSGKALKVNQTLGDRRKSNKLARQTAKAAYLSTLPKNRFKRILYRMHPKRVFHYWFSREGGIMALKIIGICIIVCFFLTIGLFSYFRKDLPKIKDISGDNLGGSVTYYDSTGTTVLWQDYNAVKRVPVESNQISPYMKDATVAIEDRQFYHEGAFDVRGIMRAAVHDVVGGGGSLQGGSTITQQLVKLNENWTDDRTITRKVKELILAVELEREYTKDDILTGYLNIAPYGGVDYGVQSAAEDYFQTSAQDLTLPEAAMLAAIPQAPSYYSPYASTQFNPEAGNTFDAQALIARQHYILDQMASQGYISTAAANAAKNVNVLAMVHPQANKYQNIIAPYFVLAAKQQLQETYGATTVSRGGWKVITTLNLGLQNDAEKIVANNLPNVERAGGDEEATVLENVPTGQIQALVGGPNFFTPGYGQNNYAADVLIPPGSSFKPYDYTTLINDNNNVGAGSVLYDTEGPLPGYPCTNHAQPLQGGNCLEDYDFEQPGPLTLRYALGGSRNIPAVKAMLEAVPGDTSPSYVNSTNKVISTASAMIDNTNDQSHNLKPYDCYSDVQLTKLTQCYDSSAIGDGAYLTLDDHVNGLSTIAREGVAIPRTFIMKITDASGNTVYQWTQPKGSQVVRKDAAYIVDNMASDPRASYLPGSCSDTNCTALPSGQKFHRYTANPSNGTWDIAVKTGTTNNSFDGLMTAWTTQYAVVSWVGYHTRNVALNTDAMEDLTEPITRNLIEDALAPIKAQNWTQPSDIKVLPSFVVRNHIHYGDEEPSPTDDIYPSWYVGSTGSKNTSETIDKVSGLLATSCTPPLAREVVGNGNVDSWNIDIFVNHGKPNIGTATSASSQTSSSATDNIHNCNDSPPTITLTAPASCNQSCTITATVTQGTHALFDPQYPMYPGTVTIKLGSNTIYTANVSTSPSTVSFTYTPTSSGSDTLSASVTDSVLYQGTDSVPMSYTSGGNSSGGGSTINMSSPTNNDHTGPVANVSWSGGSGTYTVEVDGSPSGSCQNVSTTSCIVPISHGTHEVQVIDSSGDQSNAASVSDP